MIQGSLRLFRGLSAEFRVLSAFSDACQPDRRALGQHLTLVPLGCQHGSLAQTLRLERRNIPTPFADNFRRQLTQVNHAGGV